MPCDVSVGPLGGGYSAYCTQHGALIMCTSASVAKRVAKEHERRYTLKTPVPDFDPTPKKRVKQFEVLEEP